MSIPTPDTKCPHCEGDMKWIVKNGSGYVGCPCLQPDSMIDEIRDEIPQ